MYLVYKHTSPSGKVYIGITKQTAASRWKNGLGYQSSPHFWSAIRKYGWDNIKHEILYDGLTKEEACEYEKSLISEYRSTEKQYGYNQKTGGDVGVVFNAEVRQKISDSKREFYRLHPEEREKISQRQTGKRFTDEARHKLSVSKTGLHPKRTIEHNKKIQAALIARFAEDGELRKRNSERLVALGMKRCKPIEQLTIDGDVVARYESGKEARRVTGINDGNIALCCMGKRKTAGGYKWRNAI